MTLFTYIGGTDVSARLRLEDGFQTVTAAADGSYATAGLKIDDPLADLTISRFQQVIILETACARPRTFTGYVIEARPSRGPYLVGPGRVWNIDVGDLNVLLHLQAFHTADAKRPQETGDARVAWLLGTTPGGYVHDLGFIAANTALYDEADYRGAYPDGVLPDVCETSSTNKVFFAYWDQPTTSVGLFLDVPTVGTSTSSLAISNDLADVDEVTTFGPAHDAELTIDMSEVYDEVIVEWTGGMTFLADHDGRLPTGIHRTGVFETPRIGRLATAQTHAQFFLDAHAGDIDEITCTVQLPSDKVNLIDAGMLVSTKFVHLPGYTAATPLRVARRSVNLAAGTNERYDVTLTLSTRGVTATGGGSGGFPSQGDDPSPDETIDVCNSVIEDAGRIGEEPGAQGVLAVTGDQWYFEVVQTSHTAGAKVTGLVLKSAGVSPTTIYDLLTLWTSGEIGTGAGSPALPLKSGTFTVGTQTGGGPAVFTMRVDADYLGPGVTVDECFHIDMWRGSSHPGPTPPTPGQLVPWTVVAVTPGSTTSTGTTAFPYATGTLQVKVDGVLISTASYTETDPTTGAFTLNWVIDTDEVVTVQYLGR